VAIGQIKKFNMIDEYYVSFTTLANEEIINYIFSNRRTFKKSKENNTTVGLHRYSCTALPTGLHSA
jgi:hypothetical protein